MKAGLFILIFFCVIIFVHPIDTYGKTRTVDSEEKAERLFAKAINLVSEGKFEESLAALYNILKIDPTHTDALLFLGLVSLYLELYEDALEKFQNVDEKMLDDEQRILWEKSIGMTYFGLERYDDAISHFDIVLDTDAYDLEVLKMTIESYILSEHHELPNEYIDRVLEIEPLYINTELFPAALDYMDREEYSKAKAFYNAVFENSSNDLELPALLGLGITHFLMKEYPIAIYYLDEFIIKIEEPRFDSGFSYKGASLVELGNYTEGRELLERALKLNTDDAFTLYYLGKVHAEQGEYPQAQKYFESALKIDEFYMDALRSRAELLAKDDSYEIIIEEGDKFFDREYYDEALIHYDIVLQNDTKNLHVLKRTGLSLLYLGNNHHSIVYFDEVLESEPSNVEALAGKAIALAVVGEYSKAEPFIKTALDIDPNNSDAIESNALLLWSQKNYNQAIKEYERLLEQFPDDQSLSHKFLSSQIGWIMSDMGDHQKSLEQFEKVLEKDPNYIMALEGKAGALFDLKQYNQSKAVYQDVLKIDPTNIGGLNGVAINHFELGETWTSLLYLNITLKEEPLNAVVLANRGEAYAKLGEHEKAIIDYNKALEIDPEFDFAIIKKADSLTAITEYRQALRLYDWVLEVDPDNVEALVGKGNTLFEQGKCEAKEYYDIALNSNPKNEEEIQAKLEEIDRKCLDILGMVSLTNEVALLSGTAITFFGFLITYITKSKKGKLKRNRST